MDDLPKKLQSLVYWSIEILGKTIKENFGEKIYNQIENLRLEMKKVRDLDDKSAYEILHNELNKLRDATDEELFQIAHSFGLMLEIINRCESAYRSYRLASREEENFKLKPERVIFVFTAHPTEARSDATLELFMKLTEVFQQALIKGPDATLSREASFFIGLLLKLPLGKEKKPQVSDEASHLYSIVLDKKILDEQIYFSDKGVEVSFRSWVGGDKDGHPGVDEKTMKMSLQMSRNHLYQYFFNELNQIKHFVSFVDKNKVEKINKFIQKYKVLKKLEENDGKIIKTLSHDLEKLKLEIDKNSSQFHRMEKLLWLYPALVMPLELREDAEIVKDACRDKNLAISRMLIFLKKISNGFDPKWYGRGLILSQVELSTDVDNGHMAVKKYLGNYNIPVVPLFESKHALEEASRILSEHFEKFPEVITAHQNKWGSRFEVMLGYSDSSKESGVLFSRYMIWKELHILENFFKKHSLKPVFFHGSGGSIERGGGAVKEQTDGWPLSALSLYKVTIQGEMIARNFTKSLILRSQVNKIVEALNLHDNKLIVKEDKKLKHFILSTVDAYQNKVQEEEFVDKVLAATPYDFLDILKIGSRPSKRGGNIRKLRAIPWVLCWTQTRVLLPTWWGIGSSFEKLNDKQKFELRDSFSENPVMTSYLKVLGFTLRKIDLVIWKLYLFERIDDKRLAQKIFDDFQTELDKVKDFFNFMTGQSDFLWFRPWLGRSIYFRSSMIHPINLVQIVALSRKNEMLLRETVTGIACGMMTTG